MCLFAISILYWVLAACPCPNGIRYREWKCTRGEENIEIDGGQKWETMNNKNLEECVSEVKFFEKCFILNLLYMCHYRPLFIFVFSVHLTETKFIKIRR